jgi:hypothetical protein
MKMNYPFFREGSYTFFTREAIFAGGTDYPKMINIEPTNDCFFNCIMCSRQYSKRPIGRMSFDLYRAIIDDVSRSKKQILWLTLHNDGEPLLHPEIAKMVRYAKESGAVRYVHFNTNGQLLEDEIARALIEAGLDDLTVSIDAFTPEVFASVKRAGDFGTVVSNTIRLMELKKRMGSKLPWVRAKIIDMDITHDEIERFRKYWAPIVDEVQVQRIHNAAGNIEMNGPENDIVRYPCSLLWYAMAIRWDGTVVPCCTDLIGENIIGDLKKESLQDVFAGGLAVYRGKMLENKACELVPCKNCNGWRNGVNILENPGESD